MPSWAELNKRQQKYLQAVYEVDQAQPAPDMEKSEQFDLFSSTEKGSDHGKEEDQEEEENIPLSARNSSKNTEAALISWLASGDGVRCVRRYWLDFPCHLPRSWHPSGCDRRYDGTLRRSYTRDRILQGESGARPAMLAPTIAMWVMVLLLWRLTRAGWTNSRQEAALTGPDAGSGAGRVRGRCRSRYPRRCGCR